MKITPELLKIIATRANEYAIATRNKLPDNLVLGLGRIEAEYITWNGGDRDVEILYIDCENLTEDLDEVARKRQEAEEAKKLEQKKQREIERARSEQIAKNNRYLQYLELKREFEEL